MKLGEFLGQIENYIHKYQWFREDCVQKPEWLDQSTYNGYTYYFKTSKDQITIMKFEIDLNHGGVFYNIDQESQIDIKNNKWHNPLKNSYEEAIDYYTHKYKWMETIYSKDKTIFHIFRHNHIYKIKPDGVLVKDPTIKNGLWNQPKKK